jgi:hypothetical protein
LALTEADVLNTLGDSVAMGMEFWVGPVQISGRSYGIIRDHVKVGNILVVGGTSTLAFYDQKTDILTTQIGTSPANLHQRALLLHECTHALVDVFGAANVTRHMDELAAYIAQHVYIMRSNPYWAPGVGTGPWPDFYDGLYKLISAVGLDTPAGNGRRISATVLEPLRVALAALPDVNYGDFDEDDETGADGLIRNNPFLDTVDQPAETYRISANEPWMDADDDSLSEVFLERYTAIDVRGYGSRMRRLRLEFAKCSLARAKQLSIRLAVRKRGDRVSELFYDRLAGYERAILLKVLNGRK